MRILALAMSALILAGGSALAAEWDDILARAKGQTVYWNAWAGDQTINAYIAWAAKTVGQRHGVSVRHVKLTDTAEAVARVVTEKAAGRDANGSVDLIWINGENFAAMKRSGLLFGPFVGKLPNYRLVDTEGKPTTMFDFTVPVDGLEAPWGMAQFVFMYDSGRVAEPPKSILALGAWAAAHPGRFTYPQPPDFIGTTFLKQALAELAERPAELQAPADPARLAEIGAPLWPYLEALHPHLWRAGRVFPRNGPAARQLLSDGEIDIAMSFHPAEASNAIASGQLPDTVRTYVLAGGTIGNTHFVAIPFNASAKAGAMVLANFLLSPEAQARKQDPRHWGDFTVLALDKLDARDRRRFEQIPLGLATLSPTELGTPLLEPHPSWMTGIEAAWQRRFGKGQ